MTGDDGRVNGLRLRVLVAIALAVGLILIVRSMSGARYGEPLAHTECPWRGSARVTLTSGLAAEDTFPVRKHEEVHATQCGQMGPLRYRLWNLTSRGKLSLEAPAYCAGARARIAQGMAAARVRERILDDATAAFKGSADPSAVREALRFSCPDVVR